MFLNENRVTKDLIYFYSALEILAIGWKLVEFCLSSQ